MSTAQHTPGPWRIENAEDWPGNRDIKNGLPGSLCAIVATAWEGLQESESNARLIAAAPDLLAALKTAREVIEGHFDDGCSECMGALATIDAAIAKAESGR